MKGLMAVRALMRSRCVDDIPADIASRILREARLSEEQAEEIYRLTSLCTTQDRYVMAPIQREEALEGGSCGPEKCKGSCGLGMTQIPVRGN